MVIIWDDSNKSGVVLHGVKGERDILHTIKIGTANLVGHVLRRNCHLERVTEGEIEGTGRRRRKRKQLFHGKKVKVQFAL